MFGALLPFDRSYKGSGLGLMVELLTGTPIGAQYVFDEGGWGTFFLAFSPNLLNDIEAFKKNASDLVFKMKSAKTQPGKTIHIPGYDTLAHAEKLLAEDGSIEMDDKLIEKLKTLFKRFFSFSVLKMEMK